MRLIRRLATAACFAALCLAALTVMGSGARAETVVTFTFAGDCTIGSMEMTRGSADSFDSVVAREGYAYPFARVLPLFESDDWTVVNLEGVLSDNRAGENKGKTYRFRGPTDFAEILRISSVEAVSLANNHVADYGPRGLTDTQKALDAHGIGWFRCKDVCFMEKDGIRIAFLAIDTTTVRDWLNKTRQEVSRLRQSGEAQAVVVCFHCGNEYDAHHNEAQEHVGTSFVECGADLVIIHHAHVVQGMKITGNRTILYSLGNFVFGGNSEIRTERCGALEVTSLYTLIVRAELHFSDEGTYLGQQLVLYPALTSSDAPRNNYQPFPADREQAERIRSAVQTDTAFTLPEITEENGYSVIRMPYLPADRSAGEN